MSKAISDDAGRMIEKRFSQFKSDFHVAPVYLKEISRIESLLTVPRSTPSVCAILRLE